MMILMMGKGVCRSRGRKWLNCGVIWHGISLARRSGRIPSLLMKI